MTTMTSKQEALILSLARQLDGGSYRFVEQASHLLPLSRSAVRGMSATDASLCIDHLQAELVNKKAAEENAPTPAAPAPATTTMGGPTPADMIAMLGRKITVNWTNKHDETVTWTGELQRIEASDTDGTPELAIWDGTRTRRARAHRLDSWTIH